MDTGLVIHMMVEKKYPLSQDTLSKMLSRRLEVDYQSEMGYELIRGGLLGINLHKLVLLVQELNTAQDITNSTNWVSTARRKVSTASTELNTAGRLCLQDLLGINIIVVEEFLKTMDGTEVDCCRIDLKTMLVALMSHASRIFSAFVRSSMVLGLVEADVFRVAGTLTVPN
ncbi:hypothetical protein Tco_1037698 [Tanacetum coccineum]